MNLSKEVGRVDSVGTKRIVISLDDDGVAVTRGQLLSIQSKSVQEKTLAIVTAVAYIDQKREIDPFAVGCPVGVLFSRDGKARNVLRNVFKINRRTDIPIGAKCSLVGKSGEYLSVKIPCNDEPENPDLS